MSSVMVYKTPVCPARFVRSLQLFRFQTFTKRSQPAETMRGCFAEGEKRTVLIQSVCMSSVMVYLHSARVFQSLIVLSREPVTICRLSGEKATEFTSFLWPWKVRTVEPVFKSQSRAVLSQEPLSANCPSEEITTSATGSPCPCKAFRA